MVVVSCTLFLWNFRRWASHSSWYSGCCIRRSYPH